MDWKIYALIVTLIGIPFKFFTNYIKTLIPPLKVVLEVFFMIIPPIVYTKKVKHTLKNIIIYIFVNVFFQHITLYRN